MNYDYALIIMKLVCLFVAILFTLAILIKMRYKNGIPAHFVFLSAIGIFGFVVIQFELYK